MADNVVFNPINTGIKIKGLFFSLSVVAIGTRRKLFQKCPDCASMEYEVSRDIVQIQVVDYKFQILLRPKRDRYFRNETSEADKESKSICLQGVRLAEAGKLNEALGLLNQAIDIAPDRASGYNDRAQLYRLMKRDDDALNDLERVLQLTLGGIGRSRALALCQRGVLLRARGATEDARASFAEAATLGSGFAKKQVVELNPYAALCNQMLSQVMRGEKDIKL